MKKILITGAGSYIGTSVENYLKQFGGYSIDTVDMVGEKWREKDFSGYDTVFHVAGLAHSDVGRVSDDVKEKYYRVNSHLTAETAKKAKEAGVEQFIFMSSAIVYGDSAPIGKMKMITNKTPVSPANFYGDSKVQAEKMLLEQENEAFKVVILRPPMIYGKGSRGNYPILSKLAQRCPIFPYVENKRSALYIENLAEFVRLVIDNEERGIFFPQNREYLNTSDTVRKIAEVHGKKVRTVKCFTTLLKIAGRLTGLVDKAFGNMCYEQAMSEYKTEYRKVGFGESIERTERV